jgi:hypothetical protein
MLCARCGTHEGIKEFEDELLCPYCYNIKTTADRIIEIACADEYYYKDRLRIEKLIEGIYDKGFNDGYWQSIRDDYSI